jgi:hypothetical protein
VPTAMHEDFLSFFLKIHRHYKYFKKLAGSINKKESGGGCVLKKKKKKKCKNNNKKIF